MPAPTRMSSVKLVRHKERTNPVELHTRVVPGAGVEWGRGSDWQGEESQGGSRRGCTAVWTHDFASCSLESGPSGGVCVTCRVTAKRRTSVALLSGAITHQHRRVGSPAVHGCVCGRYMFNEAATVLSWQKRTVSSQQTVLDNWTARVKLEACLCTQSCLTLCNPVDCSTPGLPVRHQLPEPAQTHPSLPVRHQLPEPAQTHVHGVGDALTVCTEVNLKWIEDLNFRVETTRLLEENIHVNLNDLGLGDDSIDITLKAQVTGNR